MDNPRRTGPSSHRRRRLARKPALASLVALCALGGAWYAIANGATTANSGLTVTSTTVQLSAKFPYLSAGYSNTREWTRTATAAAPNGTLRVAWPAADGIHVTR